MDDKPTQIIFFGDFELDANKRSLARDGETLALNAKAFDLLVFLTENAGRIVSRDEILNAVWENQYVEEANLTVQISALRKALGENKTAPKFLATISGKGYKFVADVHANRNEKKSAIENHNFSRPAVEPKIVIPEADLPKAKKPPFFKQWRTAAAILVLLSALGVGGYVWRVRQRINTFDALPSPNLSLTKLTASGNVSIATLSPDGKFFAYTLKKEEKSSLWLGHVDGGEPILLRPPAVAVYSSLNFAPDGSGLYYVVSGDEHPRGELYKTPLFGGAHEKLRENINAAITFAPDGRQFAFVRNDEDGGKSSLVVTGLSGSGERELAVRPLARRFVSLSPSWSPDGALISVGAISDDEANFEVFTVGTANGEIKPLTSSAWYIVRKTEWLKDGSGIVLVAGDRNLGHARWQLYKVSYPEGTVHPLNPDLNSYASVISLSADGKTLLTAEEETMSNIWVAPAENLSHAKQVTFGSLGRRDGWDGLDWTTDGKIVYTAVTDNSETIWMMDADGDGQKQIIPNGGVNLYPSVTDDGRFLVYQSIRGSRHAVWRANIAGGEMRQITETGVAAQPHVSPDGKWVAYISNPENLGNLYRIPIDGGEPLRLTDKPAEWLRVSPDSRFVACGYKADGQEKLAVISIEGGETLKTFDVPKTANFRLGVRWMPDGSAIAYRDWTNGVWKQNLQGGEPERMAGLPAEKLYAYGWSRDGKLFAFTRGAEIRDVVLIKDFK